MADLNLTDLNVELGAYYRTNKAAIMQKVYEQEDLRKYFNVVSGIQDEYVVTELEMAEMIQAFQKGWTPKGEAKFSPEINKVRPIKVDFPFSPKNMEATWLGYLKTNGSSSEEYPFVAYIYDQIIKRVARDLNNATINGIYVAPTAGTPGTTLGTMDGLKKKIADAITASKIAPHATGVIDQANVVAKIEGFVDSLPTDQQNLPLTLVMSPTMRKMYFRARRGEFGVNMDYKAGEEMIDFTNVTIISPMNMNSSQRMIITPATNLLLMEDGVNEEEKMITQVNRREIEVIMDMKRGVGFGIIEGMVYANDQA